MTYTSTPSLWTEFNTFISSPAFSWVALACGSIIALIFYILSCVGLMKIADKNGIRYSYLAWIPFLNFFVLGKIVFKSTITSIFFFILSVFYPYSILLAIFKSNSTPNLKDFIPQYTHWFNVSPILVAVFNIILVVFIVLYYVALYRVYKKMSTKFVMMFILSLLCNEILVPIFLFAIRNNPPRTENTKSIV